MNLWGRKWSPHPIPPPSYDHHLRQLAFKNPPPKSSGEFQPSEHEHPVLLAWPLQWTFLCSELQLFSLFHLNVHWAQDLGLANTNEKPNIWQRLTTGFSRDYGYRAAGLREMKAKIGKLQMISKGESMQSLETSTTYEMSCISQVTFWGDSCELFAALFLQGKFGTERLPYDIFHHELRACLAE